MSDLERDLHLIEAAESGDLAKIQQSLQNWASAEFVHRPEGVWGSSNNRSALHCALESRSETKYDIVRLLIAANADVNAKREKYDWRGCGRSATAFHMVMTDPSVPDDIVTLFLENGADVETPVTTSVSSMRTDGSTSTPHIFKAAKSGDVGFVRALIARKANVNQPHTCVMHNERGYNSNDRATALHAAVVSSHPQDVSSLLLQAGANPNDMACHLEQGSNPDAERSTTDDPRQRGYVSPVVCTKVADTAIHIILKKSHNLEDNVVKTQRLETLRLLVVCGADVTIPSLKGVVETSTASLAEAAGPEFVKALLPWSTAHATLPPCMRECAESTIMTVLLYLRRDHLHLPEDVASEIFRRALQTAPAKPSTNV